MFDYMCDHQSIEMTMVFLVSLLSSTTLPNSIRSGFGVTEAQDLNLLTFTPSYNSIKKA